MKDDPYFLREETNLRSKGANSFFVGCHSKCNDMCRKFGLSPFREDMLTLLNSDDKNVNS